MGKHDKYRSPSRSPHRRSHKYDDSDSGGDDDYRRRSKDYSDDEKKERKRREKEERRRRKERESGEGRYYEASRGVEEQRDRSAPGGYGYGRPEQSYAPGHHYGQQPNYGQQQYGQPTHERHGSQGYGAPPPPPPPPPPQQQQRYPPSSAPQGYGNYGQPQQPSGGYGYSSPPPPAGYGAPQYSPHASPPPAQYGGYGQHQQGGYGAPPPAHTPGYPPPPPNQVPYVAAHQQGYHQGYGGPPPATYPPPPGPPPPTQPPAQQTGSTPMGPSEKVDHHGLGGYTARPDYGQNMGGKYDPHEHSTAQENVPTEKPYFSGDVVQEGKKEKTSVLSSFTSGLNSALHDYARNLFPATSTYNQQANAVGQNTTQADHGPVTGHRFDSFARTRNGNGAKWYVDGHDYFYAVSVALERARESIFILDWWLSPELYLRRPPSFNEQYRLDRMLQAAAARGVKINIIVYKEVTQALTLNSHHTKHHLEGLHPNIVVLRHPDHLPDRDNVIRDTFSKLKSGTYRFGDGLKGLYGMKDGITLYFAHHEKMCVIDKEIAFMGGLDLCFGRWDTNEHPIADAHPNDLRQIIFPGQDYNNARYLDFQHVEKWEDNTVSRLELPRMGWSDVAMSFVGPTVKDLCQHFIERWNFIYWDKYDARGLSKHKPLDASMFEGGHGYHRRKMKDKLKEQLLDSPGYYDNREEYERRDRGPEGVRLQICRSAAKWSHGLSETEHSIANAYIEIISAAKHFVYMENQFFITATDPAQKPILNMVGRAIVDRIIRAARNNERFRIVICIPAIPAFAGDLESDGALGTRAIMEFQYRSINNDRGYSIMEQIAKAGIDPKEYIRFYNLRSYDRINTAGVDRQQAASGVSYDDAQKVHDAKVGGQPGGYAHGDQYGRYQAAAPKSGGQWDSVAKCVMLGGPDIRQVPWDGDPDKEIDAFVSEELYVHSKLLIADDRIVIIGSANMNDRSQLGDHDSEIACIIEDPTPLPSRMNGRPYTASHFAATLRRQLFRKHLGLIPAQDLNHVDANMQPIPVPNVYDFDSPEDRLVEDPLGDNFWHFWNRTAKINTDAFARVFHAVPHDSVTNWKKYREYWSKHFAVPKKSKDSDPDPQPVEKWGHVVKSEFSPGAQGAREVKEVLASVRGMLVEMPLEFLKEEDIAKEGLGLNFATETLYT